MYKLKNGFNINHLDDGSSLIYDNQGNVHSLNSTATIILDMVTKSKKAEEISSYFKINFKINKHTNLEEMISKTIKQFTDKKILEFSEDI